MKKTSGKPNQACHADPSDEQRFRIALKHSPIILFGHDRKLRYTWMYNPNPKFGNTAAQIIGRTDAELLTPARARQLTSLKRRVLKSGKAVRKEVAIPMEGQTLYYDLTVEPLHDATGGVIGLACATFDITERIGLENALKESQRRYATAERLAMLGHFMRDLEDDTAYWSPEVYRIFGLDAGRPAPALNQYLALVHPDDRENLSRRIRQVRSFGMECFIDYRIQRPDGALRTIRSIIQSEPDARGRSTKVWGILQDITREAQLQQRLAHVNQAEREAVFRDLHDTVCQELSGIGFLADSIREGLPHDPEGALQDVDKIIASAQRAIYQARNIARNLKPLSDEPDALHLALVELAAYVQGIYGVGCRVSAAKSICLTDSFVSTQLWLIAREAAINAARHAMAKKIRIALFLAGNTMILRIVDDGRGVLDAPDQKESGGLTIMRSRAELIAAVLTIHPDKKRGTIVECRWHQNGKVQCP
jgi:PAS domain S-box-containing protein